MMKALVAKCGQWCVGDEVVCVKRSECKPRMGTLGQVAFLAHESVNNLHSAFLQQLP